MLGLRLRTQLVIAAVVIISALTCATLVILHHTVHIEIEGQVAQGVSASVAAFQSVERERAMDLSRTASLLSELPPLKALMTTEHAPTIQDASETFWRLAGSDLFLLADPSGTIVGLHAKDGGWEKSSAEMDLRNSISRDEQSSWWFSNGRLCRVFIQFISAGTAASGKQLGVLAIGYEIDSSVAQQLALVSHSQIVLADRNRIVASTLAQNENQRMEAALGRGELGNAATTEWNSGEADYDVASVAIPTGTAGSVQCYVLVSLASTNAFQRRVDKTIIVLGSTAVLLSAILLAIVSGTITSPLENLVSGVRALAKGDYSYSISPRGSTEIKELGAAFAAMRTELRDAQERQIASERIAAVRRAASSISHDLRHYLAAVVANAEFLAEGEAGLKDRGEIYEDIKTASEQMTNLIDSLRELAREDGAISPAPARLDVVVQRAVDAVLAKPEFRGRSVPISTSGEMDGMFDAKKIERAFFNLVLNACEATATNGGEVRVELISANGSFTARVEDTGPGIAPEIRDHIFDPFVSYGKPNGTGLGLAIVQKIVQEHRGMVKLQKQVVTGLRHDPGTEIVVSVPRNVPGNATSKDASRAWQL